MEDLDAANSSIGVMMLRSHVLAAYLFAFASAASAAGQDWSQEPTAVLGVQLGAPLTDSRVAICPSKRVMGAPVPQNCIGGWYEDANNGALTYRDPPDLGMGYTATVEVHRGIVEGMRLAVAATNFDKMLALLVERYGPPTMKTSVPMTTLGGASLASRVWTWSGKAVSIAAVEIASHVDESMVTFTTSASEDRKRRQQEQSTKDAAGRL